MKKKNTLQNLFILYFWLMLGSISSMFLVFNNGFYGYSIIYLGIILLLHSFTYFIKHGGTYITPSGIFLLYSALIHGFASIYGVFRDSYDIVMGHYIGFLLVYFSQVLVYYFFSTSTESEKNYRATFYNINIKHNYFGLVVIVLMTSFVIRRIIPTASSLSSIAFYFIIVFISVNVLLNKKRVGIKKILFMLLIFAIYYVFAFDGFGRINIATLLVAMLMILQFKIRKKNLKLIGVFSFFPLIMMASLMRGGTLGDIDGGIGSITSPFYRLGQIVQLYIDGNLDLSFGQTIYAALVVPIPRSFWQSKPWNFNRQITYIFAPEYIQAGHSEASVLLAELVYNFGLIFGLIISILFVGILLSYLDKKINYYLNKSNWRLEEIILFTIIIVTSSGLLNLLWGGFSTFINRDGFRILFGFSLLIIVKTFNNSIRNDKKLKTEVSKKDNNKTLINS